MPTRRFPLLRSRITGVDTYASPNGGPPGLPPLPRRSPKRLRTELLAQIAAIETKVAGRPADARDPDATREIVAIRPVEGAKLTPEQLDDARADVRLIGEDPETGVVLLDAPGSDLGYLKAKIEAFADEELAKTKIKEGRTVVVRASERAVAPIGEIALARLAERAGERLRLQRVAPELVSWFELGCRGGYRRPLAETESSREQIRRQVRRLGWEQRIEEFVAAEQVYFFVRLTSRQLRELVDSTDCIYEADVAPPEIRDWRLLADQERAIRGFRLLPPPAGAPAVVVIDSGVATRHPLLEQALLPSTSVVPGYDSPEDTFGHGTRMAGVSLYEDLGAALDAGQYTARHWVQGARILVREGAGTATEENRHLWPALTEQAVRSVEEVDPTPRHRAFVLAVTRPMETPAPTLWANAVDQIAFHDGRGRLVVVASGNARYERWLALAEQYPQGHLGEKLHEPAQAVNALTVGAYTTRTRLPPDRDYDEAQVVAPNAGGISPFTSTGLASSPWPIKPDVVMEGGNLAVAGGLTDGCVDTLVALTTGLNTALGQPLSRLAMTSEASARAGRFATAVWVADKSLRPDTVRGLIVHSASWTQEMVSQFPGLPDRLMACGYGVPDLALARECANDRATIVVEDEMPSAVIEEVPKKKPPKRKTTKTTEPRVRRKVKLYEIPIPDRLPGGEDPQVELRVTLSFFAEPNSFRRRTSYGLELKWDMQGPQESPDEFYERVNELHRPEDQRGRRKRTSRSRGFDWDIGIQARSRGTVQSDRWRGPFSQLAGNKYVAVLPVLGWWDQRRELKTESMPFSLLVTIRGPDVYGAIKPLVDLQVAQPIEV